MTIFMCLVHLRAPEGAAVLEAPCPEVFRTKSSDHWAPELKPLHSLARRQPPVGVVLSGQVRDRWLQCQGAVCGRGVA